MVKNCSFDGDLDDIDDEEPLDEVDNPEVKNASTVVFLLLSEDK